MLNLNIMFISRRVMCQCMAALLHILIQIQMSVLLLAMVDVPKLAPILTALSSAPVGWGTAWLMIISTAMVRK